MKLTEENLNEWKDQLNQLMFPVYGCKYTDTQSDQEWLNDCLGYTPEEIKQEEIQAASES